MKPSSFASANRPAGSACHSPHRKKTSFGDSILPVLGNDTRLKPMQKHEFPVYPVLRLILVSLFFLIPDHVMAQETSTIRISNLSDAEKAIHASIGWAKNKDLGLLYQTIANDSLFIEVHPDNSILFGFEEFKQNEVFWMSPDFRAISYEIKNLHMVLSESGTVVWFYCLLNDFNEWKNQPSNWENVRWTGVLEKRKGRWQLVMSHFSYPVQGT